jgi:thymidine kinase
MSLTLILGCMFGGKTTELLRLVEREESIGRKVLVVNHSVDSDRSGKSLLKTHSGKSRHIEYEITEFTSDIVTDILKKSPDSVAINEGQFFKNLGEFVLSLLENNIDVIVCGLDSDFKRRPFREMTDLIPHANDMMKLYALCGVCKNGTRALYSKRVKGGENLIEVGGSDSYIPVCRKCYGVQTEV